jgi:hypothetical protein
LYQNITKGLHNPTSYTRQCAARGVSRNVTTSSGVVEVSIFLQMVVD